MAEKPTTINRKKDGTGEYLIPDRIQTLEFLDITAKKFPSSTIKHSFKKYGFNYDFRINIDVALEFVFKLHGVNRNLFFSITNYGIKYTFLLHGKPH